LTLILNVEALRNTALLASERSGLVDVAPGDVHVTAGNIVMVALVAPDGRVAWATTTDAQNFAITDLMSEGDA
jgi:hypothetical protein